MKNLADVKKEFPSLIEFLTDRLRVINIGRHVNIGLLVSYPLSSKERDVGNISLVYSSDGKIIVSKSATINPRAIDRWNNGLSIMLTAYVNGDRIERRRDKYQEIPFP